MTCDEKNILLTADRLRMIDVWFEDVFGKIYSPHSNSIIMALGLSQNLTTIFVFGRRFFISYYTIGQRNAMSPIIADRVQEQLYYNRNVFCP